MAKSPDWTAEEDGRLMALGPSLFREESERLFPGRTTKAVQERVKVLGIIRGTRLVRFARDYPNPVDGGYVSGLVDGEGWFMVSVRRNRQRMNYNPKFGINLRADDRPVLEWLRGYFGCGGLRVADRKNPRHGPAAVLTIAGLYDLMSAVLPHFDRYPLRAKKARDFAVWRKMVEIQAANFRKYWSEEVRATMAALYAELRAGRAYRFNGDTSDDGANSSPGGG